MTETLLNLFKVQSIKTVLHRCEKITKRIEFFLNNTNGRFVLFRKNSITLSEVCAPTLSLQIFRDALVQAILELPASFISYISTSSVWRFQFFE